MKLDELAPEGLPQFARSCPRCAARRGMRCVVVQGGAVRVLVGVHMARINEGFKHLHAVDRRQIDMFREVSNGRRRPRRVVVDDDGRVNIVQPE